MARSVLFCLVFLGTCCSAKAQFLPAHEIYSKLNGIEVGMRMHADTASPSVSININYHDNSIQEGEQFATLNIPRDVLNQEKSVSGTTNIKVRLPGCNLWHEMKAKYQFDENVLQFGAQVNAEDLWNQDCKSALANGPWRISLQFPKLTVDDRIKLGLLPNRSIAVECNVVPGRNLPLDKLVGMTLTVFPNGWAHDADVFRVKSKLFTDMHINSLGLIGPDSWAIKDFDVFALGDKVDVKSILKAPRPGGFAAVRGFVVEVVGQKEGKTFAVDLDQLVSGDVTKCAPVQLIGPERRMGGVFVKLKAGAKPVVDVTRTWIQDPLIRFGFCQDFRDGRFQCQTREYPKADIYQDSWSAEYDEVEVLTALP